MNSIHFESAGLVDIKNVHMDGNDRIEKRYNDLIRCVKNPYRFLCGTTTVNVEFAHESQTLERHLVSLFSQMREL